MRKVGLFGGSFDPIHKAHIDIANEAIKQLNLDALEFIPTQNNPWKNGAVASFDERVQMIQLAIQDYPQMHVNMIEKDQDVDKNYTIYTIQSLLKHNQDVEYYYIIGMDQANLFHQWKDAKLIDELVHLVVFERGGYTKDEKKHQQFHFTYLNNQPLTISSSAIREGNIQALDKKVMHYISQQGIYLDTMIRPRMKEKRYLHSLSVAKLAAEIAESNGLNQKQAYIAGVLHDVAKEMDDEKATELMQKYYPEFIHVAKPVWHQWLSKYVSETEFYVDDEVVLKAIENHTTAALDISPIGKCVYVADKLDPLRGYDSSASIELCKKDIHEGFKQELIHFYEFSTKNNRKIDKIFNDIYNRFVVKGEK